MVRRIVAVLLVASCVLVIGCGTSSQKGVNKDYDRPKAPDTKK